MWISLALIVATLAVYAPVRHHDFVDYDDLLYVTENAHVASGLSASNISWALTSGYATNWHPLTWVSHMIDVQLFGLNAGPQHVTSIALHIANSLLLFWLLRRMTRSTWRSAFVAALFALHPLHVESVAWIAERKDVLSTLFWLLTMWAYVAYVEQPRWTRYLGVVILFVLGLMAKPMVVTLPFVLLLVDIWPLDRLALGWPRLIREKVPLIALAVASMAVTFLVQLSGGSVAQLGAIPLAPRIENSLVSYVAYVVKMIWPAGLAVFYPYPPEIPAWQPIAALLLLVAVSLAVIRASRTHPYLAVGWFWYIVTLLPVIGIVQVGRQALADRYTYIPLIGLFIVIAWGAADLLARWPQRRTVLAAAAAVIVLACTITARAQVGYWQNSSTLWYHALSVTPDNDRAHNGVGILLMNSGHVAEATAHFSEAVRIDPTFAAAQRNLGVALAAQGQVDAAVAHYREALRFNPDLAEAHHDLGVALAARGQFDEAIAEYKKALALTPNLAEAHGNLAGALVNEGKLDEAVAEYNETIRLKPTLAEAHSNLARVLTSQRRFDAAIDQYREALRIKPTFADAHLGMGFALTQQGKVPEAIDEYSQALRLNPNSVEAHYNRGYALATQGRVAEAIADFSEAVRIRPDFEPGHMALAMALNAAGRFEDAKRELALAKGTGTR